MRIPITLMVLTFATVALSQSQKPPTREELERQQNIDAAISAIDDLERTITESARDEKFGCMKAFGHEKFCECISQNIPVIFTFEEYVVSNTRDNDALHYSKLSADKRAAVDAARQARDKCVKAL